MPHSPSSNRRRLLKATAAVALVPSTGLTTAATDDKLTTTERDELEATISGIFGDETPLPLGLENSPEKDTSDDEDDSNGFSLSSILGDDDSSTTDTATSTDAGMDTVVDCANAVCASDELALIDIMGEAAETGAAIDGEVERQAYRVEHLLRVLVERGLVNTIDPEEVSSLRQQKSDIARYLPLIGSFNNVCQAACAVDETDHSTVIDFYLAVGAFCVEVIFFKFAVGYRLAFNGTRVLATRSTAARLLQQAGPRMHAFLLSEVHWAIRGGAATAASTATESTLTFVYDQTTAMQDAQPQQNIEGLNTDIDVSYQDLAELEMFDCGDGVVSGHERSDLRDQLGRVLENSRDASKEEVASTADTVTERMNTIVEECYD